MFIGVEGCLGSGKTTVASGLAAYRKSQVLLEDFESNPFLTGFYEDPIGNALETEFAFLLLHYHQLKRHSATPLSSEIISDFHLGKDLVYADLNLKDFRAKRLFRDLYQLCIANTPTPAIIIYLAAPTELLVERIRKRNRHFEVGLNPAYYAAVNQAYETYFGEYPGRSIRIPMDEWDFVADTSLYARLSQSLDSVLGSK